MKPISILFLAFILIIVANAGSRVSNMAVTHEGRDINLSWEMTDQFGVEYFNVQRRTVEQEFSTINDRPIPVRPSGRYEFIDKSIYKQENAILFYRIVIVDTNGSMFFSKEIPLGTSSVRRTWGSIKSMFR